MLYTGGEHGRKEMVIPGLFPIGKTVRIHAQVIPSQN